MCAGQWVQGFPSFVASPRQVATMRRWETKAEKKPCCFPQSGLILGSFALLQRNSRAPPLQAGCPWFHPQGGSFPAKVWPAARAPKLLKMCRRQSCRTEAEMAGGALQQSGEDFCGAWHQRARLAIFRRAFCRSRFPHPLGKRAFKIWRGKQEMSGFSLSPLG